VTPDSTATAQADATARATLLSHGHRYAFTRQAEGPCPHSRVISRTKTLIQRKVQTAISALDDAAIIEQVKGTDRYVISSVGRSGCSTRTSGPAALAPSQGLRRRRACVWRPESRSARCVPFAPCRVPGRPGETGPRQPPGDQSGRLVGASGSPSIDRVMFVRNVLNAPYSSRPRCRRPERRTGGRARRGGHWGPRGPTPPTDLTSSSDRLSSHPLRMRYSQTP
jgi:hypothetical protein